MNRPGTVFSLPATRIRPESLVRHADADWAIADSRSGECLVVRTPAPAILHRFDGEGTTQDGHHVLLGPLNARNAARLRECLPWLTPVPLGQCVSFGFGDRLGLATPGHIRALRKVGGTIRPVFAQQSARELQRTNRTAQNVLDAATWGSFGQGWIGPQGADADHLKSTADIDAYLAAGFSMFTIDPGEHVGRVAPDATPSALRAAFDALPWPTLEDAPADALRRYAGRTLTVEGHRLTFADEDVLRAAVKYGRAVAHVAAMWRHLASAAGTRAIELEVSVDETDEPTTHLEHVYVASELRRLDVVWSSLAPRLVGRFEKGVDYIGDVAAFEADWRIHAAIARHFGPYRLSLHSGSDKFSIYGAVAECAEGAVHVKTAGTSWLEAVRTIATVDPALFREIYAVAFAHYDDDRASYHVSAQTERAPRPAAMTDAQLPSMLDQFDARQILHVTFGSILKAPQATSRTPLGELIKDTLRAHPDHYAANLELHFARHLRPFAA